MNRIDRLMAIVLFLQSRRLTTSEELAAHFEVSQRTVYRDVSALSEAGVPIISEAGVGYSIMKGYHLPPVTFTPDEASALATGGVFIASHTDASMKQSMSSALMKLRAILPDKQRARLEKIESHTELPNSQRHQAESAIEITQLQLALCELRLVDIAYHDGRGQLSKRTIEPVKMLFFMERWHLIAWCRLRNDFRDFRIDRVQSASVTDQHFEPRPDGAIEGLIEGWCESEESHEVQVQFSKWHVDRVLREWSLGVRDRKPVGDHIVFTLSTGKLEWMAPWLMSFGTGVTVLDSPELVEIIIDLAQDTARHHQSNLDNSQISQTLLT